MTNLENIVQQLYIAYYNRPAEPAGLSYWATTLESLGGNLSGIIKAFVNTPESQAIYGANATAEARINAVYDNIFGRAPDQAGLNYWADLINNKGLDMGEAVMFILQGAQGSDASVVNQKLSIASYYTEQIAGNKLSQSDAYKMAGFDLDSVSPTSTLPSYMTPVTAAPLSSAASGSASGGVAVGGSGVGGGVVGGGAGPLFSAELSGGVVYFGGTDQAGAISVAWSGAVGNSNATFSSGANQAPLAVAFAPANSIQLNAGRTIQDTAADLNGLTINGAGTVIATGYTIQNLSAVANTVSSLQITLADGANRTLDASAYQKLAVSITGGDGNDTITGGSGADTLGGAAGNDTFVYAAVTDLFTANVLVDSVTGGDGTDIIRVDADGFTIVAQDSFARAATVDTLAAGTATANAISITLNANAFTAGVRTVTLAADTNPTGNNTISATNASAGQNLTLTGSAGVDAITGGAGNDNITGGAGADVLNGGAGADVYIYTATADGSTTPGSGDTIATANFVSGTDVLQFANAAFGSMGAGALLVDSNTVAFSTGEAQTLTDFTTAAGVDANVYTINLTGSTLNGTLYDAIDAAAAAGTAATGAAFYVVSNGTNTVVLYDAAAQTAGAGTLVELVTITGLANAITGLANNDLMIA